MIFNGTSGFKGLLPVSKGSLPVSNNTVQGQKNYSTPKELFNQIKYGTETNFPTIV